MRMTLEGLNRYVNLFEHIITPGRINKQILIDVILEQSGDLYPYYQSPTALKRNIENWFLRRLDSFDRMAKALGEEYNAIENYDRMEDTTIKGNSKGTTDSKVNSSDKGSSDSSNINSNTSFDSGEFQDASQNITDAHTQNDSETKGKTDSVGESDTRTISRIHGNIGLTSNVQLIREELTLREYDLYEQIARMFEKSFIVQIY